MRDCYRPVLLFAAKADDAELLRQLQEFRNHGEALRKRDIRVVVLLADHTEPAANALHGLPLATFNEAQQEAARKRFDIHQGTFTALLIGKDGGEKMRSYSIVPAAGLNKTIDAMPMRQDEMRQR